MNVDAIALRLTQPISDALRVLDEARFGIVLLTDDEKHLIGTITDGDIRRAVLDQVDFKLPVSTLLARKKGTRYMVPVTAPTGGKPTDYIKILKKNNVLHLPLIDQEGKVQDVVRLDDLMPTADLSVQAVLMAGGAGKRLLPLTMDKPKPMLPVGNRPLMEIIIENLRKAGIRDVKITTHHKADEIVKHFEDGAKFNVNVSYIDEKEPLGTAGALGLLKKTGDTLLVMNGDILTDMDFRSMVTYHREHKAECTVAVRQYDVKVPYGVVECVDQAVTNLVEKPVYNFFVNAGIYLIEPKALESLKKKGEYCDMPDLIKRFVADKRTVVSFPIMEEWIDIGQHHSYEEAQRLVESWGASA